MSEEILLSEILALFSLQLTTLEEKNEQFQNAFKDFEKKLGEKRVLCREKEVLLENLKKREKELVATVQR